MNKSIISTIIVVVIIIGASIYFYTYGAALPSGESLLATQPTTLSSVGSDELALLNQVNSLKIDLSLFTDPAFTTLTDRSKDILRLDVGRENPFASVPGVPSPFDQQKTTTSK